MRRGLALICLLAACHEGIDAPTVVTAIQVVSGGGQTGVPGYRLATPVSVRVIDDQGRPVAGDTVTFTPDDQAAVAEPASAVTDTAGIAHTNWRLGGTIGTQSLQVRSLAVPAVSNATVQATVTSNLMTSIDGGYNGLCGVDTQGRLSCWLPPRLGAANPPAPTPQSVTVEFTQVTVPVDLGGGSDQPTHGCALTTTGRVWCFSLDAQANVVGLSELPGAYPPFAQLTSADGEASYCALTADGQAWCWGSNQYGGLGDGTTTDHAAPAAVLTATRFAQLDMDVTTCAVALDGSAWCWGYNNRLAAGVASGSSTLPTQLATPVRFSKVRVDDWQDAACGFAVAGGLYCWGNAAAIANQAGASAPTATPTLVATGSTPIDLVQSAGLTFVLTSTAAIQWDGDIYSGTEGGEALVTHLVPARLANVLRDVQVTHGFRYVCGHAIVNNVTICPSTEGLVGRGIVGGTMPSIVGVPFP